MLPTDELSKNRIDEFIACLERLSVTKYVKDAARALFKLRQAPFQSNAKRADDAADSDYNAAVEQLRPRFQTLVPAWIDQFLILIEEWNNAQQSTRSALRESGDIPALDFGRIHSIVEFKMLFKSIGDAIDPHIQPLFDALGRYDRDCDEFVAEAIEYAGSVSSRAVESLRALLRKHGDWCMHLHVGKALVNASRYDATVIDRVRDMLNDPSEETRRAAMRVLGEIGPAAASDSITSELLSRYEKSDAAERISLLQTLAKQGDRSAAYERLVEAALRESDGYVRRGAVGALQKARLNPTRFVPLLIKALEDVEPLHDGSVSEYAVWAFEAYGSTAAAALTRLRHFVEGPMSDRTIEPKTIVKAIESITGEKLSRNRVRYVAAPLKNDDPVFHVRLNDRVCFVNVRGEIVLETGFSSASEFVDGIAIVCGERKGGRRPCCAIDRRGEVLFDATRFEIVRPFREGRAAIRLEKKWGFLDTRGNVIVNPSYDAVTDFSEGLAGVESGRTHEPFGKIGHVTRTSPGLRGFIDSQGQPVIPIHFEHAQPFQDGRASVLVSKKTSFNDDLGIETFTDRKYGYINRSGTLAIPGQFEIAGNFSEGLAVVQERMNFVRQRWGYIDRDGNIAIPMKFTAASAFHDGLAVVCSRGRRNRSFSQLIDRSGHVVAEIPSRIVGKFCDGLVKFWDERSGLYGYVDREGRQQISPQFEECSDFEKGIARVTRRKWFALIDRAGNCIWGPTAELPNRVIAGAAWNE